MLVSILEYLKNYYPQIAGYFLLIFIVGFLTYKLTMFYVKTKKVCDDHEGVKSKLNLLLDKFNSLIVALYETNIIKDTGMFKTESPVRLTDEGYKFIKDIGWDKILADKDKRKFLFDLLDKLNLKTKADVERYSLVILNELYGSRETNPFTEIKEFFYNNAAIDKKTAIFACSIYLRDEYIKEHIDLV